MTPDDDGMRALRLYDFLNCAATAVDEDGSGRWRAADRAWLEAIRAAEDLFPDGSDADSAASVIIRAAAPSGKGCGKAALWNALNAASLAVLAATAGQRELASVIWPDAVAAADQLDHAEQMAVLAILAEAADLGVSDGVTA